MLSEASESLRYYLDGYVNSTFATAVAVLAISWLAWRLWTFTIAPLVSNDNEPELLPYLIPYVGHTIAFFSAPDKTIRRGNEYFKGDEPYRVFVGGNTMHIIRNTNDVQTIWRDTKALTFDQFMQNAFKGIGVPESSFHKMFLEDPSSSYLTRKEAADGKKGAAGEAATLLPHFVTQNPRKKRYIDLQEDWIKEQLQPGPKMDKALAAFLGHIDTSLQWGKLTNPKVVLAETPGEKTMSLYRWCRFTLVDAGMRAFIGDAIFDLDPDFVQHYMDWENVSWKVAYQHPGFLSRDMQKARERLVAVLSKYYTMPEKERPGLAWLFNRMQSEQQALGLTLHDAASISVIMLWGIHLNTFRILFWTLAHILCNPHLIPQLRAEIASAPTDAATGRASVEHLTTRCPLLNAAWQESLRLYNVAAVARGAERDTLVHGKLVRAGSQVLGPFRLFHLSEGIFGADALQWRAERWLDNPKLEAVKGFHPFGGGSTYCPGRIIAKSEVCTFLATALDKYDMQVVGEMKVPPIWTGPVLTAFDPDGDVTVKVRERKR